MGAYDVNMYLPAQEQPRNEPLDKMEALQRMVSPKAAISAILLVEVLGLFVIISKIPCTLVF